MKIGTEDLGVFIDGAVLYYGTFGAVEAHVEPELMGQKVQLGAKGEGLHVFVEVIQIWIVCKGRVDGLEAVSLVKELDQRGLSCSRGSK